MSSAEISMGGLSPSELVDLAARAAAGRARRPAAGGPGEPMEQAARDFESVFLYKLMEEMRRTVPESGLLDSGVSEQFQGMFWYYLSQDVADKGGLGLWKGLCEQFGSPASGGEAAPKVEQSL